MDHDAEKRQAKEALGQVDSSAADEKYYGILEEMLDGSGEWIFKERLFKKWVDHRTPIMWVFGGPGAGKSFLSTFMISHLEKLHTADPQHLPSFSASYFYIKESNQQMRSLITILRRLSFQIARNNIVYRRYVASFADSIDKISTPKRICQQLFLEFSTSTRFENNFAAIVLDGVDEAETEDRECLIKLLKSLQE
jgi:Cdc6-like AAA superfamily ATPase